MAERVRAMLPSSQLRGITLSTFHALGLQILKKYIEKLDYKQPFLLLNQRDQESLLTQILVSKKIDPKKFPARKILGKVSLIKNGGLREPAGGESWNEWESLARDLYPEYEESIQIRNSVDFDDLILLPLRLFREFPEIQSEYEHKFRYFMVDEFQDTNMVQYDFLRTLMGANLNLCVVGDDDQSIYAFRGSNVELILNFENDFPGATVVRLLENYRCTSTIMAAAASLIEKNQNRRQKQLFSRVPSTGKVKYRETYDEEAEAEFVVEEIKRDYLERRIRKNEIAVLFRTNFQSRPFEEALRRNSIAYNLVGAYSFFDRKEVRDLLSYIRCIANARDDASLLRILNYPKRGIGEGSISKIHSQAVEEEKSIYEMLLEISETPGRIQGMQSRISQAIYEFVLLLEKYRKRFATAPKLHYALRELIVDLQLEQEFLLEESDEKVAKARLFNCSELVNMLSYFEDSWDSAEKPTLFDFINRLHLMMDDDSAESKEENKDRVQLLTIHQSKGLEFDSVYIVGMEEGILPNGRVIEEGDSVDEERRLLYVAMTRARRHLWLTGARNRRKFGEIVEGSPSRFLEEIDKSHLEASFYEEAKEQDSQDFLAALEKLRIG